MRGAHSACAALCRLYSALALLLLPAAALACGYCVEDGVAAAYDHAMVTRALARQQHVAFFRVEGIRRDDAAAGRALAALAAGMAGVGRDGTLAAADSSALAVAFDPRRTSVAVLQRALEQRLAARKISLTLLQVMDETGRLSTPAPAAKPAGGRPPRS